MLERWHSKFDPLRERIAKRHLWVLLPHLSFPLWSRHILEGIENIIGRFVSVEDEFHQVYDKRIAKILVEMYISRGLPAEVEILCNERLLIQRLDYVHVPFRCSCYCSVGHLRNSCPHRFTGGNKSEMGELRSPSPSVSPSEGLLSP